MSDDVRELADQLNLDADYIENQRREFWKSISDRLRHAASALRSLPNREQIAKALQQTKPWWHGQETVWQDFGPEADAVLALFSAPEPLPNRPVDE